MLNLVYSALKKRLAAQTNPKYIDWYNGQYLESEMEDGGEILYDTPAQFIEFAPLTWKTLSGNVQTADLQFTLHLVNHTFDTDDRKIIDPVLNHFGKETAVFQAMMNWRSMLSYVPGFESLAGTANDRVLMESVVRQSSEPDHQLRRQLVSMQTFTSKVYDYSAVQQYVEVLASLNLDIQKVSVL